MMLVPTFQFHKGTIRTRSVQSLDELSVLFQFHKGTIRTNFVNVSGNHISVFQFHKGTIRTDFSVAICLVILYFNSIKVRLELVAFPLYTVEIAFQFHKGTIRTACLQCLRISEYHFNSIKVRLELSHLHALGQGGANFNSIKVRLEPPTAQRARLEAAFQFHKGTIRTRLYDNVLHAFANFNSIKVRLEL